jgi:hypothetical protein
MAAGKGGKGAASKNSQGGKTGGKAALSKAVAPAKVVNGRKGNAAGQVKGGKKGK